MSELIPRLIVERMIPPELWVGLMTGKYDLFVGVVRVAKGLPNNKLSGGGFFAVR